MRLDTGKGFGRVGRGKVSTVTIAIKAIVIISDLLLQMIWLDISVEKKGSTYWSKMVCLCGDKFGTSNAPHVHIWDVRRILSKVSQ